MKEFRTLKELLEEHPEAEKFVAALISGALTEGNIERLMMSPTLLDEDHPEDGYGLLIAQLWIPMPTLNRISATGEITAVYVPYGRNPDETKDVDLSELASEIEAKERELVRFTQRHFPTVFEFQRWIRVQRLTVSLASGTPRLVSSYSGVYETAQLLAFARGELPIAELDLRSSELIEILAIGNEISDPAGLREISERAEQRRNELLAKGKKARRCARTKVERR